MKGVKFLRLNTTRAKWSSHGCEKPLHMWAKVNYISSCCYLAATAAVSYATLHARASPTLTCFRPRLALARGWFREAGSCPSSRLSDMMVPGSRGEETGAAVEAELQATPEGSGEGGRENTVSGPREGVRGEGEENTPESSRVRTFF